MALEASIHHPGSLLSSHLLLPLMLTWLVFIAEEDPSTQGQDFLQAISEEPCSRLGAPPKGEITSFPSASPALGVLVSMGASCYIE